MSTYAELRERCVVRQLAGRGVNDARVLAAMRAVPREAFVPADARPRAYEDCPLAIGYGQTISQPFIVGYMAAALALKGGERVLEIGAGSGYAAAVIACIAADVFAVERIGALARQAERNLRGAGILNVHVRHADGSDGWPEEAPFDAILVSAGAPDVPSTLFGQLARGGRMVVPVGSAETSQQLIRVTRGDGDDMRREVLTDVRFVPLIGREGWNDSSEGERSA